MMEFLFEIIFEIIGECFGAFIKNKRINRWTRIFVLSLLWLPLIGLMIFVTDMMYQELDKIIVLIILGILDILMIIAWLKTIIGIIRG